MKHPITLLLILTLSLSLSGQGLQNAGFELRSDRSKTGFAGWETKEGQTGAVPDSSNVHSGKYSLRIHSAERGQKAFYQTVLEWHGKPGKYLLAGWISADSVIGGTASLWATVTGTDRTMSFNSTENLNVSGTQKWQRYYMDLYLDDSVDRIFIGGMLTGRGTARFDDLELVSGNTGEPVFPAARAYVREVFAVMREKSIRKDSIDFNRLEKFCAENMAGEMSSYECYPMVRYILSKLGDRYSAFQSPGAAEAYSPVDNPEKPSGKILDDRYAYLNIPVAGSNDSIAMNDYANEAQRLVRMLDGASPSGWIIDLRNNGGGNWWPVIAGLGPILGEGTFAYVIDAGGNREAVSYRQGASLLGDTARVKVTRNPYYLKKKVPVAVLIGPGTAGSGELTALAFTGGHDCRLFGEATAGHTSSNKGFRLSDGATIYLTTAIYYDRDLNKFGGPVKPDVPVAFPAEDANPANDPVIRAAINWLGSR